MFLLYNKTVKYAASAAKWRIHMKRKINVVVWNEFRHEKKYDHVKAIYPNGMHATIKEFLE